MTVNFNRKSVLYDCINLLVVEPSQANQFIPQVNREALSLSLALIVIENWSNLVACDQNSRY